MPYIVLHATIRRVNKSFTATIRKTATITPTNTLEKENGKQTLIKLKFKVRPV
jgi:hypothetical protein